MYYSLFVSLQPFTFSIMSWKNCRWNFPCKQNLLMWHLVFFSPMCLIDAVSGVAFNNVTHPPPIHPFLFLFFGDVTALVNFFGNVTSPIFLANVSFRQLSASLVFGNVIVPHIRHQTIEKGVAIEEGLTAKQKRIPSQTGFFTTVISYVADCCQKFYCFHS